MNRRLNAAKACAVLALAAIPATASGAPADHSPTVARPDARVLGIQAAKPERTALSRAALGRTYRLAPLPAPGGVLVFL